MRWAPAHSRSPGAASGSPLEGQKSLILITTTMVLHRTLKITLCSWNLLLQEWSIGSKFASTENFKSVFEGGVTKTMFFASRGMLRQGPEQRAQDRVLLSHRLCAIFNIVST